MFKSDKAGYGRLIHDHIRQVLIAFAGPLIASNAILAELHPLSYGVQLCSSLGIVNLWIEVDDMPIKTYLNFVGRLFGIMVIVLFINLDRFLLIFAALSCWSFHLDTWLLGGWNNCSDFILSNAMHFISDSYLGWVYYRQVQWNKAFVDVIPIFCRKRALIFDHGSAEIDQIFIGNGSDTHFTVKTLFTGNLPRRRDKLDIKAVPPLFKGAIEPQIVEGLLLRIKKIFDIFRIWFIPPSTRCQIKEFSASIVNEYNHVNE
ncbi:hypothetical protein IEQ34_021442 [Dendrobium chrysotoxum]|uniref:RNase H type-1 domain-containing protein n=1 Tax=Dendrobium chrysotoxum TaxID=161865 RepID=A0AAV7FLV7_DENCH|nr:hypothetical protein IEQ34_021442 [Dendrobium chrysotoxum]